MELKAKTELEIESIVQAAIDDAVDFVESEISEDRITAQRYYDGEVDIGFEDGRSKVVATKVRDTVRAIKPSLMRVFLSTARPVEFMPHGPEDVNMAEQATDYVHYEFQRSNGYRVLNDAFHDALIKKQGIVKAYWEEMPEAEIYTYTNLSNDEYTFLVQDDEVTVLEHTVEQEMSMDEQGAEIKTPVHSAKVSRKAYAGCLKIESVPPEEFFVDRNCRTLEDAHVVVHRSDMRASDLIAMGFEPDEVLKLDSFDAGTEMTEAERYERQGYEDNFSETSSDPSMRSVTVTEAYMRMDVDGTGVAVLHRFLCGGTKYKLLDYELADELPFAKFEVDPEPHTFYGRSIADLVLDDQDAATSILRGILDNVAMTNNPRVGIVDGAVNIDDVLNNEIGAIVRMRQAGAVQDLAVPFTAGQTLSALTYLDQLVEGKTGVTRASMGLDPDAMQSTTKAAVQATVQAAAGQVEVMVRNLADGARDLFGLMLRLLQKNMEDGAMMRMNGRFQPVDPKAFDIDMDVTINVGLGTGREEEKTNALAMALQQQTMVYQTYGPMNGLVSLTNIRNTLSDILASSGIRNADRYFAPITPEIEMQLLQMQQQQQAALAGQNQPQDPAAVMAQAEQMKAQTRAQVDLQRAQMDDARKREDMTMQDDLKRDQMAQNLYVDAAKTLGQYGSAVDIARIKAEQEKERQINDMTARAAGL
ncbi:hypothetical protein N8630_02610 [Synechococcus sp. AH-601-C19]|nr:hypothetical protein [Synechococcus sp. AH-601-C19]